MGINLKNDGVIAAIERAVRVADQQCTAYGHLRDRFLLCARGLDLSILAVSTWLLAMTFVEPRIGVALAPAGIEAPIWIGLLSIGVFFLSLVQLLVNWKAKADSYQRSLAALSEFVKIGRPLARAGMAETSREVETALALYHQISEWTEPVPEKLFLPLKQKHVRKVEISKALDTSPSASILRLRISFWIRDNLPHRK